MAAPDAAATFVDGLVALAELDFDAVCRTLAASSSRAVTATHRASLLGHPAARDLNSLDTSFTFEYQGGPEGLTGKLRPAFRSSGLRSSKTIEAVAAEASHLARFFAAVAEDPEPTVRLLMADDLGTLAPAAWSEASPAMALVYSFPVVEKDHLEKDRAALPLLPLAATIASEQGEWPLAELPVETVAVVKLASDSVASDSVARPVPDPATRTSQGPCRLVLVITTEHVRSWDSDARSTRWWGGEASREARDVLLVSMPFGPLPQPSLGLSLLKQTLDRPAEVLYFTLPFARRIGVPFYNWITEGQPFATALLGEWLFRHALFPQEEADEEGYFTEVLCRPTRGWFEDSSEEPSFFTLMSASAIAEVLRIRRAVDGFLDECVEEILAYQPKIVALTSVFQQQVASLALARRLEERAPDLRVVLGGPNCEGIMGLETARQFPFLDAVVSGEGEVVFPQLVERWLAGLGCDGLRGVYTHTSPGGEVSTQSPPSAPTPPSMDALPHPDFDDFFDQWNGSGLGASATPRLLFETSRGCWWGEKQHCTFCGLNGTNMAFRSKSAERALFELKTLSSRYPGLFVGTVDNILDMRYFKTLLPKLADEDLNVQLFYEVKANLKKDHLRQLRAAGVTEIQPGIESLSDEVLAIMRKGVKGLQNLQLLKWCHEIGVWPHWNFLWGFPGEPESEYARMADLLPLLHHLPPPGGMSKIYLERFSPNHFASEELGFVDVRAAAAYRHLFPFAADVLDRLAFYFSYDYRDGRDVASYVRPFTQRIVEWREAHQGSQLIYFDRGDHLILCDSRPMASESLNLVDGLARELLLAGDAITTIPRICTAGPGKSGLAREDVEQTLAPLLARGWMVRQGDSVLTLALPGTLAATGGLGKRAEAA